MPPLAVLALGTVVVVALIVRLRLNAFVALIAGAALVGVVSPNVPVADAMKETAQHFGRVAGNIAIVIAMAAIVGQCLMESGAAERIVRSFVALLGERRAGLSMLGSGYVLSVPVFFDTVFYLLVPLARAMSLRTRGGYVLYALAISAGGVATHVLVPPTPGPLVIAATLEVDLGMVILVGLAVAVPSALAAYAYAVWIDRKLKIAPREAPGMSLAELGAVSSRPDAELPPLWLSFVPILLPVALITSSTVANVVDKTSAAARWASFWGDSNFALMASAFVSLWILGHQTRRGLAELGKSVETAVASAGVIILITAGGGAFGGMLVKAGVGEALAAYSKGIGLPPLVLGFLIASLFRVAQGSATVAMITASAIVKGMIDVAPLDHHPVYLVMAIGGGSVVGQWMNDSGFWIFRTMMGLDELETLKTKSVMTAILGTTAMLVSWLASRIFPLV